ncbi:MAG: hypothetical protein GY789_11005 [Hyphomicrobiales bacterium]|nr:hypothetical protein [Hyphomicrobiales bacterium]
MRLSVGVVMLLMYVSPAWSGEADVVAAKAVSEGGDSYRFDVTVRHDDAGWDHFANGWEVVAPDGTVLASRTLFHPHVDEQPFTRSLGGIRIPPRVEVVTIRAHDNVHGYGGVETTVPVP